jgi:glycerol-3-phosphate dehydrogenase (NAD(P)+)
MNNIAVIGAGAWGTALAIQAHRAGRNVTLWARDPARAREIAETRRNPNLPSAVLPAGIIVTNTLPSADLLLLAVPVQHLRAVAANLPPNPAAICAKGVELGTLALPLEILGRPAAVVTGPNFAHEIAAGLPAAAVVAADDPAMCEAIAAALGTPAFRLYASPDPIGAQIGGAAKNVIAIASGIVIGAGLGENARAALVSRGLAEMSRLAIALGGRAETVAGLSGLGDLMLTCAGTASRNFSLGRALGTGVPLSDILAGRHAVTEGVATAPAIVARAHAAGVTMPICAAVAGIVGGNLSVPAAIDALLSRPRRAE